MNTDRTINQLIEDFLIDQDINEQSKKCYRGNLKQFIHFCIIQNIKTDIVTKADVIFYKSYLLKTGKAENTINFYLKTVKQFFVWLKSTCIYDSRIDEIKCSNTYTGHRKGYLKNDQVKQLLASMPRQTISDFRNFAIVTLMLRSLIRRIEVYRLNVENIYIKDGLYFMDIQRKGSKFINQTLGLTTKTAEPIFEYLSLRNSAKPDEPLFINHSHHNPNARLNANTISVMIKDSLKAIGINDKSITAHSLRHTGAITAIRANITIQELQKTLGHTNSRTTDLYLTAIDEEERTGNKVGKAIDTMF